MGRDSMRIEDTRRNVSMEIFVHLVRAAICTAPGFLGTRLGYAAGSSAAC